MKVTATITHEVEITTAEVGRAIMQHVHAALPNVDDVGCDWYTDTAGCTYIAADPEWQVSTDPEIAILVDAANLLQYDHLMRMPVECATLDEEIASEPLPETRDAERIRPEELVQIVNLSRIEQGAPHRAIQNCLLDIATWNEIDEIQLWYAAVMHRKSEEARALRHAAGLAF